jgi:hypothetical protein
MIFNRRQGEPRRERTLKRKADESTRPKGLTPWVAGAVCLFLMSLAAGTASAQPLDFKVIAGQWARIDGSYTLRIENVMSGGKADVSYFNPGRIHVAESRVDTQEGRIRLFVRLRDTGYPDCAYTLFYYPDRDVLAGAYYQAAVNQTYEVMFVRKKQGSLQGNASQ